jgi:hypothetical protein
MRYYIFESGGISNPSAAAIVNKAKRIFPGSSRLQPDSVFIAFLFSHALSLFLIYYFPASLDI